MTTTKRGRAAAHLRTMLLSTVGVMQLASPALAQTDAATSEDIVVTGARPIRESEAAALAVQRLSDSLVTVAAADSVGRLPDQNIAQATGRLPGVAVERDQGQARYISLRGAPKTWTTLSFDGINIVSPEGRDTRYDSIPSAIASQIIVSKAVTPDMPGETVSGNVNVITRSAFDYQARHIAGKLGAGQAQYGKRAEYDTSLVVSDRFDTGMGEIGVLLSGSYYERNMITDNFEHDWERVDQDRRPGNITRFWAHETENKLYRLTRRNYSGSARVDWRPSEGTEISLRSIFTTFTDDEARDNYRFDLDDRQGDLSTSTAACATGVNPNPTTTGYADVCIGNTPYTGTVYGIDIRQRSTLRAFEQSIFTNTLEGKHDLGDWTINWLGNYTESKDDRSVTGETSWDSPSTRTARPTVRYDFTDIDRSRLALFTTTATTGPTGFRAGTPVTAIDTFSKPLSSFSVLDAVDTTEAYTGKFVITRDMTFMGADTTFKAGVQYDQRTKTVDERQIFLNTAGQFATIGLSTDYNQFSSSQPFLGKIPMGYTFRYFDTSKMEQVSDAARANFAFTPNTANIYDVREQVLAGFLMGTVKYDWGSVVGGVRVEHLKNRGIAEAAIGARTGLVTAESEQTLYFPSLHFNYNLDDTKKLRLSYNTGAARADYDQLRPNVVVNDANQVISGGNPAVEPETAYGFDAYLEWYTTPAGFLSAGVFYKHVDDVLYRQSRTFGSDSLNSNGVDRSSYLFTGITNGGEGELYGVEFAAQQQLDPWTDKFGLPSWTGGFGISANVTFNDSQVTKPAIGLIPTRHVPLPNASDLLYNVGLYYEKYGLSARLQYQYRSHWLDTFADDLTDGGDTYWDEDNELDFSARYAINQNFEIFVDAANLLNEPGRRFSEPGNLLNATGTPSGFVKTQTIEWERFGSRYTAGIRFNF